MLFHEPLLEWIVEQINGQKDTDKWEDCLVLRNLVQMFAMSLEWSGSVDHDEVEALNIG